MATQLGFRWRFQLTCLTSFLLNPPLPPALLFFSRFRFFGFFRLLIEIQLAEGWRIFFVPESNNSIKKNDKSGNWMERGPDETGGGRRRPEEASGRKRSFECGTF